MGTTNDVIHLSEIRTAWYEFSPAHPSPARAEVLGAIARGASTAEIAAEVFLSNHTVRGYVKAMFEELGVSSRGELVARLFAEHYTEGLHSSMAHID